MNVPFVLAAILAVTAAAIHGIVGERLVVAKLGRELLPSTRLGGPSFTKVMIRATWHITTIAFLVTGSALAACAPGDPSQACRGIGRLAAIAYSGFTVLLVGLVFPRLLRGPRKLPRHPAPLIFALVAVLSWWGTTS